MPRGSGCKAPGVLPATNGAAPALRARGNSASLRLPEAPGSVSARAGLQTLFRSPIAALHAAGSWLQTLLSSRTARVRRPARPPAFPPPAIWQLTLAPCPALAPHAARARSGGAVPRTRPSFAMPVAPATGARVCPLARLFGPRACARHTTASNADAYHPLFLVPALHAPHTTCF